MNKKELLKKQICDKFEKESAEIRKEMNNLPDTGKYIKYSLACIAGGLALCSIALVIHFIMGGITNALALTLGFATLSLASTLTGLHFERKISKTRRRYKELEQKNRENFEKVCNECDKIDMLSTKQAEKLYSKSQPTKTDTEKVEVTCWESDKEVAESIKNAKNYTPNKDITFKVKDNDLER